MSLEDDLSEIFGAPLVAEKVVDDILFQLYENRIFYVRVPRLKRVNMEVVGIGYQFLDDSGGGVFKNVYHFDHFADVDPQVREWASDDSGNLYTISDAIVIESFAQKILTDFYVRVNRPIKPTKIFYSLEKAIAWTHAQ